MEASADESIAMQSHEAKRRFEVKSTHIDKKNQPYVQT